MTARALPHSDRAVIVAVSPHSPLDGAGPYTLQFSAIGRSGPAIRSAAMSPDTPPAESPAAQPPEVVIRPVRSDDAEGMHRLRLMQGSLEFTLALPSERLEGSRRRVDGLGPDDHSFVAVLDGQIVG